MLMTVLIATFGATFMGEYLHENRDRFNAAPYPTMFRGLGYTAAVTGVFLMLVEYGPDLARWVLGIVFPDGIFSTPHPPRGY